MWSGTSLVGGTLSGIGSIIGSILSAEYAEDAASTAYERQLELLGLQQNYATNMSNSAYQRAARDLRKAGLNPILAATNGQGASTPVVSAPSVNQASSVDFGDLGLGKAGDIIGKSSSQALAAAQAKQVAPNASSQRALNDANAASARAQADLMQKQKEKVELEKDLVRAQTKDANSTHFYKLPGLISHELLNYLQTKFPGSSSKSRSIVVPDIKWNRENDPNYHSLINSPGF